MVPFKNDYTIPETIPEYTVISTEEKADWSAKWIWDKENILDYKTDVTHDKYYNKYKN